MDIDFQEKIDEYLLHSDKMSDDDKKQFLNQLEEDADKKEQYEFTKALKESIVSREDKLKALKNFQKRYRGDHIVDIYVVSDSASCADIDTKNDKKSTSPKLKVWVWISSIAAVAVIGFFTIRPYITNELSPTSTEQIRGNKEIFEYTSPVAKDTLSSDSLMHKHEVEKENE